MMIRQIIACLMLFLCSCKNEQNTTVRKQNVTQQQDSVMATSLPSDSVMYGSKNQEFSVQSEINNPTQPQINIVPTESKKEKNKLLDKKEKKKEKENKPEKTLDEKIAKKIEKLTKEYELNQNQINTITPLVKNLEIQKQKLKDKYDESDKEREKAERKEIDKEFKAQLSKILSPDQIQKYELNKKDKEKEKE